MPPSNTLAEAVECLRRNESQAAEEICRTLLSDDPEHAQAWHLMGILHAQREEPGKAVKCFLAAIEHAPERATYHYNLGLAWRKLGQLQRARDAYRRAIDLRSDFLEARNNLGNTLQDLGEHQEALECFRELVRDYPDHSDGHFNLANTLQDTGKYTDAIEYYRRAVELDAEHDSARENLGRALSDQGELDEAADVWRSWLEREPDHPIARHMLASASGDQVPTRCDEDYVRQTFDEAFAKSFDRQLTCLKYRAPQLVAQAVAVILGDHPVDSMLDAGCGTGWCGPLVRSCANHLVGVDLSADMLALASRRAVYDETIEAELTAFMNAHTERFDLILSADTFCYFGDLVPVLAAAFQALRRPGHLVLSVELDTSEGDGYGYRLQRHGRYCHREEYLRQGLQNAGFQLVELAKETLRTEVGQPVDGLIATAKK